MPGWRRLAAGVLVLFVAACATRRPAPVEDRVVPQAPRGAPAAAAPAITAKPAPPPIVTESEPRAQSYTVKRGDTLYLIALDHGLDYRELAAWNNIENVNLIRVGQVLRLTPPAEATVAAPPSTGVTTAPLRTVPPVTSGTGGPTPSAAPAPDEPKPQPSAAAALSRHSDTYKTQPKALKEPYSEHALRDMQRAAAAPPAAPAAASTPAAAPGAAQEPPPPSAAAQGPRPESKAEPKPAPTGAEDEDEKVDWVWPSAGKLVTGFSDNANLKGIDIAGKPGQPVLASAGGKVVYAGTGLRGYGKLIIIKHNKSYLSAYAHNKDILVKEGQQVTRGQKIAEMGNTDTDQVKLHFEIRRLGKPMDPLKYLPPA